MKTISELTDFYYKELYPALQELEKDRKKIKKRFIIYSALYLIPLLFFVSIFFREWDLGNITFLFIISTAGTGLIYKHLTKDYRAHFKQEIIDPLIHAIDTDLTYLPKSHIDTAVFNQSRLFTLRPDSLTGNDYVSGQLESVDIAFSDLTAKKSGKNDDDATTIFQGLFIVADFHKNFKGTTVILPDNAQKLFGDVVGNWLQANNSSRNQLIKMDNVAFEKEFVVYGTDQIEARYILTPSLMQKILNYKKRSQHPLYISFVNGKIHMAVSYNKDLFEPSLFHSLLEYKIAKEYFTTLHLALGIVEDLKLNQKLWSKI